MSAFYGYLDPIQQQDIWTQFLHTNGLTANPANTDTVAQAEFMSFVQSTYATMQTSSLSPEEIQRRHLVFAVYDALVTLLNTIQGAAAAESNALQFLAQYQRAYTDMISRIPTYIGGSPNTGNLDLTDPSKFTLGYAGITLQDVYEYMLATGGQSVINSYLPTANGKSPFRTNKDGSGFVYNKNDPANSDYYYQNLTGYQLTMVPDLQNHTVTMSIQYQYATDNGRNTFPVPHSSPITVSYDPNATVADQVKALNQGLISQFGSFMTQWANLNTSSIDTLPIQYQSDGVANWLNNPKNTLPSNNTPFIPWSNTFNLKGALNLKGDANVDPAAAAQRREQKNSLMQQYVQNLSALRQTIKTQADTIGTNLDTSRQAVKGQDSICASIIQQMNNIMNSLFR